MKSRAFDTFMEDLCQSQSVPLRACYEKSFCLSADVTAAYDPNFAEVYEKRNSAFVNYGMGLCKYTGARGKSGASDASRRAGGLCPPGAGRRRRGVADGRAGQGRSGRRRHGGRLHGGAEHRHPGRRRARAVHACPFETVSKLDCYMTYKGMKAIYEAV